MKTSMTLLAALFISTAPVHATTLLSDNFDNEAGGSSQFDYAGFTNFDVSGGTVDQIHDGDFGINCAGGTGGCVDLDGSTQNGGFMITKSSFAFNAGDLVTLSFDLSGNQRGGADDNVLWGFSSIGGTIDYNDVILSLGGAPQNLGAFLQSDLPLSLSDLPSALPFTAFNLSFKAGSAGAFKAYVGTDSADNIGPILDNFRLDISAVPEPASWALMIGGFALIGLSMRRRRLRVSFA